jgi:hypothetical protein
VVAQLVLTRLHLYLGFPLVLGISLEYDVETVGV